MGPMTFLPQRNRLHGRPNLVLAPALVPVVSRQASHKKGWHLRAAIKTRKMGRNTRLCLGIMTQTIRLWMIEMSCFDRGAFHFSHIDT